MGSLSQVSRVTGSTGDKICTFKASLGESKHGVRRDGRPNDVKIAGSFEERQEGRPSGRVVRHRNKVLRAEGFIETKLQRPLTQDPRTERRPFHHVEGTEQRAWVGKIEIRPNAARRCQAEIARVLSKQLCNP